MADSQITLVLPPVDSQLHAHNKGHWRGKTAAVKSLRRLAYLRTRICTRKQWDAATIVYRFYFPDRLRRDAANAIQATKPAIDGVVDAGLIPDDDWTHLQIAGVECAVDKGAPRVELVFRRTDRL